MATAQLGILVALVPAAWAVVAIRHPRFTLLTTTWLVVTAWFAASYTNAAIDRYYLGPLVVVVAWLGIAAGLVVDAVAGRAVAGEEDAATDGLLADPAGAAELPVPPTGATYGGAMAGTVGGLVAGALAAALIVGPALLAGPATAARIDVSSDRRAADWSRWVLASVPENAVVVSWWSFSTPLWYRTLLLGERPDVWVLDDRDRLDAGLGTVEDVIRSQLPVRPVVVIRTPREIQRLEASWLLDPVVDPNGIQPLYLVVAARGGAGSHSPEEAGTAARSREPRAATMPP
jgi:hypothetical protein